MCRMKSFGVVHLHRVSALNIISSQVLALCSATAVKLFRGFRSSLPDIPPIEACFTYAVTIYSLHKYTSQNSSRDSCGRKYSSLRRKLWTLLSPLLPSPLPFCPICPFRPLIVRRRIMMGSGFGVSISKHQALKTFRPSSIKITVRPQSVNSTRTSANR